MGAGGSEGWGWSCRSLLEGYAGRGGCWALPFLPLASVLQGNSTEPTFKEFRRRNNILALAYQLSKTRR